MKDVTSLNNIYYSWWITGNKNTLHQSINFLVIFFGYLQRLPLIKMLIHWQCWLEKVLLMQVGSYKICNSYLLWSLVIITCYAVGITLINLLYKYKSNINITKNNEALENKVADEARFSAVFEKVAVGIIQTDKQGRILQANSKFCQITGYNLQELQALEFQDITHPDDLINEFLFSLQIVSGEISNYSIEKRLINKDGYEIWINLTVSAIRDVNGEILELIKVVQNISDRIETEAALRQSEERFRAIFNEAAVGISHTDFLGNILQVNPKFCEIVGYSQERLQILTFHDITNPEDLQNELELQHQLLLGKRKAYSCEKRYIRQDNSSVWVNITVSAIYNPNGEAIELIKIIQDISLRKELEQELAFRQSLFDGFFSASSMGMCILDDEQRFVQANSALAKMNGYSVEAHLGKTLTEILPDVGSHQAAILDKVLTTGEVILNLEMSGKILKQSETQHYWLASYFPIFDKFHENNQPIAIGICMTEITERKEAEEKLQRSEAKYKMAAKLAQEQATKLEQALKELGDTQAQLIQNEKMSSLGQLVAGIAHEINNPANFIYGNITPIKEYAQNLMDLISLYQKNYPEPVTEIVAKSKDIDLIFIQDDLSKILSSIKTGTERISKIVLSLRSFSRLDEAEMKTVDIHEGIDSTLMILQNRLKEKANHPEIQVIKDYTILPLVECYAGQLNQVFMNILSNAIDALEEAILAKNYNHNYITRITIKTKLNHKKQVIISIADNGVGMTSDVIKKIFDPFFTTKQVGSGTGLGMAISYKIIEKHGGKLICDSTPGEGTEFVIKIPVRQ